MPAGHRRPANWNLIRMLLKLLKSWTGARDDRIDNRDVEYPEERVARLKRAYERAPTDLHRDILYRSLSISGRPLNRLVDQSLADSKVKMDRLKALHRPLASFFLIQYFHYASELEGAQAECGVFGGTSALLLCRSAQIQIPDYRGAGLHLIDSFEGLSAPSVQDVFPVRRNSDVAVAGHSWAKGEFFAPIDRARNALKDFPDVTFHAGWIPEILAELPDTRWSFVHLDVDLYAPTLASLAYFYPRLSAGGVIICDDYGAPLFPGAHRAWDDYCEEHDLPYVVLDTGQSVIVKT